MMLQSTGLVVVSTSAQPRRATPPTPKQTETRCMPYGAVGRLDGRLPASDAGCCSRPVSVAGVYLFEPAGPHPQSRAAALILPLPSPFSPSRSLRVEGHYHPAAVPLVRTTFSISAKHVRSTSNHQRSTPYLLTYLLSVSFFTMSKHLARAHTSQSNRAKAPSNSERKTLYKSVVGNPFHVQWYI